MTASVRSPFPDGSDGGAVSLEDFHAAVEVGACVVVDVREPHEFAVGRIPGATNLPLSSFDPEDLPKGRPIVLVCQAGARSARALQVAVAAGVTDIRHYPGGTAPGARRAATSRFRRPLEAELFPLRRRSDRPSQDAREARPAKSRVGRTDGGLRKARCAHAGAAAIDPSPSRLGLGRIQQPPGKAAPSPCRPHCKAS